MKTDSPAVSNQLQGWADLAKTDVYCVVAREALALQFRMSKRNARVNRGDRNILVAPLESMGFRYSNAPERLDRRFRQFRLVGRRAQRHGGGCPQLQGGGFH